MATRSLPLRALLSALVVVALASPADVHPVRAAAPLATVGVADFEDGGWIKDGGVGTVAAVTNPVTSGAAALRIDYDMSGGAVTAAPRRTPPVLPGAPRSIELDVLGDASWNVLYVELQDATGEVFRYWAGTSDAGSLGFTGWRTLEIPIGTSSPALVAHHAGDADGALDLPLSLYDLVVYPDANRLKTVSSVVVDHLVVITDPGPVLQVAPYAFAPSASESATVSVRTADAGPVTVRLNDSANRVRTLHIDAPGGGAPGATAWDGRADDGTTLSGLVSARVTLTGRGGADYAYEVPYAAGVAASADVAPRPTFAGVSTFMTYLPTTRRAEADRLAGLAERSGVTVVRESFDWHNVEPQRQGYFHWAQADQAVAAARAHQLDIMGRLQYTASWASSAPSSVTGSQRQVYPPRDVADFAAYAREVVHRYKDRIHVWQIWNEQNLAAMWRPAPDPAAYAALLKAAYAAIKAEDPGATVVLGGLSTGPDQAFLQGLREAGAWSSFDVLAIHSFVSDDPNSKDSVFPGWIDTAKATVAAWGEKPIWISEWGWSTHTGGTSEANQAVYTAHGFSVAAAKGVGGIFLYELVDHGTNAGALLDNYGTVTTAGRVKPVFEALRCSAAAIAQGELPACVFDTTRPVISSRSPANGATAAPRDSVVTAVFSEPVHGLVGTTIRLRDVTAGSWVRANLTYSSSTRKARLTPTAMLPAGHRFRVYIANTIVDVTGNLLVQSSWEFVSSRDATRPKVSRRSPSSGATGVSRSANVYATFSETMRPSSITGSTVRLRDTRTGAYVPAKVTWDAANRRAVLNPSTTLAGRRTYQVVVTSGARDRAGNRAYPTSWKFTTRA
ncbi:MAG: Ig-like domain-containing protein [Chloroflexota bacterium]